MNESEKEKGREIERAVKKAVAKKSEREKGWNVAGKRERERRESEGKGK